MAESNWYDECSSRCHRHRKHVSYTPSYDNRLRQLSPTSVLSTTTYVDLGKSTSTCRDLILFDLSGYKTTDTISKATLSLYWYYPASATRTSETVVEVYRPAEWDPKYVTWNSRMSGVSWSNAGGNWYDKNGDSQGSAPYLHWPLQETGSRQQILWFWCHGPCKGICKW